MRISTFVLANIMAVAWFPASSWADFKGPSEGGTTTVQDFQKQCDLKTSGGGGLLGDMLETAVEGAKCDDLEFVIQGNIVSKVSDNIYKFKDSTGSVTVEIDDWNGVDAGPDDVVRLSGEADYEETGLVLDVEQVELVK